MTILGNLFIRLAQAERRNSALYTLRSMCDTISEHIIKILVWKNTTNDLNKWSKEISANLIRAYNLTVKPKNKRLSWQDYKEYLFDPHFETKEEFIQYADSIIKDLIESQDYPTPEVYSLVDMWDKLQEYILSCKILLTTSTKITRKDFTDNTQELGK